MDVIAATAGMSKLVIYRPFQSAQPGLAGAETLAGAGSAGGCLIEPGGRE